MRGVTCEKDVGGGAGGMAGSLLRAWIYAAVPGMVSLWLINIIGSFLIGFAVMKLSEKSAEMRLFISTGLLGSFTTFSAFSNDWFRALENSVVIGAFYGLAMTAAAVAAAAAGLWLGRKGVKE